MSTHASHRRPISRRALLGGGAAAALGLGLGFGPSAVRAARAAAPGTLPLTVVNHTNGYANDSIHVYILGNDGTHQVRVTPDGSTAPVALADNGADGYTDYALPLAAGGDTKLTLPQLSGRIYVSYGDKLKIKAVADGAGNPALQYPAGWVSSDPNYPVRHDWTEFTFNSSGMFTNTTMVDMFGLPLTLGLTGSAGSQTAGTLKDGARAAIFSAVKGAAGFDKLVVDDLRVIAPGHGIDAGLFDAHYYDAYIDQVWSTYAGTDLTVTTNAGAFTGRVSGDRLAFTGPASVSFAKPATSDVLYCAGALAAPNDGTTGPVAAALGAAFNRSTLLTSAKQPTTDASAFYQGSATNHYAAAMHAEAADGKAYGFPFDDVAGFASYIQDTAPTAVTLTLDPL